MNTKYKNIKELAKAESLKIFDKLKNKTDDESIQVAIQEAFMRGIVEGGYNSSSYHQALCYFNLPDLD